MHGELSKDSDLAQRGAWCSLCPTAESCHTVPLLQTCTSQMLRPQGQQTSQYLHPCPQRKYTVYLEIFPQKDLEEGHRYWRRHHNNPSGTSGPAVREPGGNSSSLFTDGLIVSRCRRRPCIISRQRIAPLKEPPALFPHPPVTGPRLPGRANPAGPCGGCRDLYPATQESSSVLLAEICLQISPH